MNPHLFLRVNMKNKIVLKDWILQKSNTAAFLDKESIKNDPVFADALLVKMQTRIMTFIKDIKFT